MILKNKNINHFLIFIISIVTICIFIIIYSNNRIEGIWSGGKHVYYTTKSDSMVDDISTISEIKIFHFSEFNSKESINFYIPFFNKLYVLYDNEYLIYNYSTTNNRLTISLIDSLKIPFGIKINSYLHKIPKSIINNNTDDISFKNKYFTTITDNKVDTLYFGYSTFTSTEIKDEFANRDWKKHKYKGINYLSIATNSPYLIKNKKDGVIYLTQLGDTNKILEFTELKKVELQK